MHLNQCNGCGSAPSLDLTHVEILWFEVKSSFKCPVCSEEGPRCSRNLFNLFWYYRKQCNVVIFFLCSIRGKIILQLTICSHNVIASLYFVTDMTLHCVFRIEKCDFEHWSTYGGGGGAKPPLCDDATGWFLLREIPEGSPAVCRGRCHHPPQEYVHNAPRHCASKSSESTPHLCSENVKHVCLWCMWSSPPP